MQRTHFALAALLAVAPVANADTQTYGFELSNLPETEVCEQVKHAKEQRCFLTEALSKWWSKGSTENRQTRRATEAMEAERAALGWARVRYANDRFKIRITNVEETRGVPGKARPRAITMAVEERAGSWMTRLRVLATPDADAWQVHAQ